MELPAGICTAGMEFRVQNARLARQQSQQGQAGMPTNPRRTLLDSTEESVPGPAAAADADCQVERDEGRQPLHHIPAQTGRSAARAVPSVMVATSR